MNERDYLEETPEQAWTRFTRDRGGEPGEMLSPDEKTLAVRDGDGTLRFHKVPKRPGEEPAVPQYWQVRDLWHQGSLVLLYGMPDSFKTFLALDWANCFATGIPWQEHSTRNWGDDHDGPAPVLYVIAEGAPGFDKRQEAWKAAHPGAPAGDLFKHPEPVNLLSKSTRWLNLDGLLRVGAPLRGELDGEGPLLVVFDTLHRCMPGGSDVSDRDMGLVVDAARTLQDEWGCAVLFIHHSGWAGMHERGSNVLRGATDSVFRMKRADGGKVVLSHERFKDGPPITDVVLRPRKSADSLVLEHTRADTVLEAFRKIERALARAGADGLLHGEIVEETGLPKATVTRRLQEKVEAGEVRKDETERYYEAGARLE